MTPALILTLCALYLDPGSPVGATEVCTIHPISLPYGLACEDARAAQQPAVTANAEALFSMNPGAALLRAELSCAYDG